jgi:hypothetical protein
VLPPHLQHTSLVHAYLFVSVTPLAIAVGSLLLRKPISSGEVAGTLLGVAGAAVLTLGPKGDHREVWRCCWVCTVIIHADAVQQSGLPWSSAHWSPNLTCLESTGKICATGCCTAGGSFGLAMPSCVLPPLNRRQRSSATW